MSALGHKRTYAAQPVMSALPPKADMCSAMPYVCFGPKADIGVLFDHLVCTQQKCFRDCQTECFGRGQIDHQDELGRLLYRQVGGLRTFENFVDYFARAPKELSIVCAVGHKTSSLNVFA